MADSNKDVWSKLNDDMWMGVREGRIDVAKPGDLGIQCIKCGEIHIIGDCNNCGNGTYRIGYSSDGHMGLFCGECNQGFISLHCNSCGCDNPISRKTIVTRIKGCYIVTATCGFGSPEVAFFYRIRDDYLSTSYIGRKIIKVYYLISPYLANIISKNHVLRSVSYKSLVNPAYKFLNNHLNRLRPPGEKRA